MNCKHKATIQYTLTLQDRRDFCQRLEDFLSGHEELAMAFLTPTDSKRGHRAKSMLTTTMTTAVREGPQTHSLSKLLEIETDTDEFTSYERRRSSGRRPRRTFLAPSKFFNCGECGALYFHELCVAIKPRQYCYRAECSPVGLLCSFFNLQGTQRKVYLQAPDEVNDPYGQQFYLNGRKRIIDGVYKMGCKFQQARETIHIAIEIIDQYYLRMSQITPSDEYKEKFMHPRQVIMHQVTSLLLASKYDEVDDNITAIRDLRLYVTNQLNNLGKKDLNLVPTYDEIIECERCLLAYFDWNFNFLLPLHFIRLQLANGIIFSNELKIYEQRLSKEDFVVLKQELTKMLTTEALSLSDLLISKGACFLRKEQPSNVAAAIIYFTRKNILFADKSERHVKVAQLWPDELILMTRCTEVQIKKLLQNPLEETYSADLANSTKESASQPKQQNTTDTKTQSSSRRQLISQETSTQKDTSTRKMYNTLSPPAKTAIPITSKSNQQPPPKTESKPNERTLPIKSESVHKKPVASARVLLEVDSNLIERSARDTDSSEVMHINKKDAAENRDGKTDQSISIVCQKADMKNSAKKNLNTDSAKVDPGCSQRIDKAQQAVGNHRVQTFRQNLIAASTSNLRLNQAIQSNLLTNENAKPASDIGSGLINHAGSYPTSTENATTAKMASDGVHGRHPLQRQQQFGSRNVERTTNQYIPSSIQTGKQEQAGQNPAGGSHFYNKDNTAVSEVEDSSRNALKSIDSSNQDTVAQLDAVVNSSLPEIVTNGSSKKLFDPVNQSKLYEKMNMVLNSKHALHMSQVSMNSVVSSQQLLPMSDSMRPVNKMSFSNEQLKAAQQFQQQQFSQQVNESLPPCLEQKPSGLPAPTSTQPAGQVDQASTLQLSSQKEQPMQVSEPARDSNRDQKHLNQQPKNSNQLEKHGRQNSKNLNRNNLNLHYHGAAYNRAKVSQKIILPHAVHGVAGQGPGEHTLQRKAVTAEAGLKTTRTDHLSKKSCIGNQMGKNLFMIPSVPDSIQKKLKSTDLPQVPCCTSATKSSTDCMAENMSANAETASKAQQSRGKASSCSKIGIIDEAINNSNDFFQTHLSRQRAHGGGAKNAINSQASNDSLVKVLKSQKATDQSAKKAIVTSPTQIKNVSQKPKGGGINSNFMRSQKNFHKLASSMVQPNSQALKHFHAAKNKGKRNNQENRGGSQDTILNAKVKSPKQSTTRAKMMVDFTEAHQVEDVVSAKRSILHQQRSKEATSTSPPHLPNIAPGATNLQENNSKLANFIDPPSTGAKERYGSASQSQEVLACKKLASISQQPNKLFVKTSHKPGTVAKKVENCISGKQSSTSNVRLLTGSLPGAGAPPSQQQLNQGFSKNMSQYFGAKEQNQHQTLQSTLINSQRIVLNAIRKGPSFAGMNEIATPQSIHESGKPSHRMLAKGQSHQIIQNVHTLNNLPGTASVHSQQQHNGNNKFAKNAVKNGGRNHSQQTQQCGPAHRQNSGKGKSSAAQSMRSIKSPGQTATAVPSMKLQQPALQTNNISQTLVQVANTAMSSKQGSVARKGEKKAESSGASQPLEKESVQINLISRKSKKVDRVSAALNNLNNPHCSPVIQNVRPNKNRNYNTAANLTGTIPSMGHGLINANFSSIASTFNNAVSKTGESKGSFQSSSYNCGAITDKHFSAEPMKPQSVGGKNVAIPISSGGNLKMLTGSQSSELCSAATPQNPHKSQPSTAANAISTGATANIGSSVSKLLPSSSQNAFSAQQVALYPAALSQIKVRSRKGRRISNEGGASSTIGGQQ